MNLKEWRILSPSKSFLSNSDEIVCLRASIKKNKIFINIQIGDVICQLVEINKNDRIDVYINNHDNLLIKKSSENNIGHKLCKAARSKFLFFNLKYETNQSIKLNKKIYTKYEINNDKTILIDLLPLKLNNILL